MSEPSANPATDAKAPAESGVEITSQQSEGLGKLFETLGLSLLVSTYQANRLIVMRNDGGVINTHLRHAAKPMGIAVAKDQLAVGTIGEILFYAEVPATRARLEPAGRHDACFVQRYGHITGEIDIHEMAFGGDSRIWFINTRFSALCTIEGSTSFVPVWRPPFVSAYAPEDRCHLNGLGLRDGKPRYVTALGETDKPRGWRDRKADGGVLIDLATGRTLCRGLSMPHSPRWHAGHLWVCESGKGLLSRVDPETGTLTPFFQLPGFTRGLDFFGPFAFVGLSQIRETAIFSGIPISEKAKELNCAVCVINISDGTLAGSLRFTQGVQELFAVQALPGLRFPEVLARTDPLALESYFLPPETLKDVRLSPIERRAYGEGGAEPRAGDAEPPDPETRGYGS